MIGRILTFSVRRRGLVVLVTLAAAMLGGWSAIRLPIDAVPDVTNVQVQVNGFAQVTAVFSDRTDIYFARQQVAERLNDAKANLPPGVEVRIGPTSTGLG